MAVTTDDRWTCPFCHRTETTKARTETARRRVLRRVQEEHGRRHARSLAAARGAAS